MRELKEGGKYLLVTTDAEGGRHESDCWFAVTYKGGHLIDDLGWVFDEWLGTPELIEEA